MYPNEIFLGLDLYSIFLCVGIFVCILTYGWLADRLFLSARLQKFCFVCALFAIPLGYGSAVLFQAFYNFMDGEKFVISASTGATFYGGLIGGAAVFLLIYFVAGRVGRFKFEDGYHVRNFFGVSSCAAASIAVAHAFGRLGCLMAGCCHGEVTDAWYGIYMHGSEGYAKYVPIQLFEAIFLFLLFALFVVLVFRKKTFNLPLYMMLYGAWRFFIEYARADDRGKTVVSFLSPSQLIAVIMILGGVGLLVFERYYEKKHRQEIICDALEISKKWEEKNVRNGEEN